MPTAHLGWNANPEPDIDHYLLYVGSSTGNYDAPGSPLNAGNTTSAFFALPGLGTFFFALQAVNTANQPSGFSSEVMGSWPADQLAPQLVDSAAREILPPYAAPSRLRRVFA